MPYQHIEEIQSRKGEKIALFLTIENALGLILVAFPVYLVTASLPFLLRVLIIVAAAALGVVATLDVGGMTFYERVLWRVRGELRRRISPAPLTPDMLAGAATVRRDRPLPVGGPIQLRAMASSIVAQRVDRSQLQRTESDSQPEVEESHQEPQDVYLPAQQLPD